MNFNTEEGKFERLLFCDLLQTLIYDFWKIALFQSIIIALAAKYLSGTGSAQIMSWRVSHQNEMAIDHFWCQGNYLNADKQQYECKTLKYKTKKSLRQLRSKTGGSLGENDNFPVMPGHLPFLENCHLATLLSKIWLYNWR